MSPLGQLPDFLTDGSRIRCPPVGNTQNPIFRLAAHWHQRISDIWSRIRLPCLAFIYSVCTAFQPFTYHASVSSVPIFIWSQVIITFSLSNIRFPGNRPPFFAVDFPCRFSKKLPVLFYVQYFSPLSASLFSHLPPFPCSTFFSARHLRRLSPGIFRLYHRPQTLLFLPGSSLRPAFPFFAGIGRNCPLSALLPIRFPEAPAQPAHNPKVLLSAHAARQMILPGLKIKISYPYQCYHKDGKEYQILFAVKVVTF